jgi:hypothetical protein
MAGISHIFLLINRTCLGPVSGVQLSQDALHVVLDCEHGDSQVGGDFGVSLTLGDKSQNLLLSLSQTRYPIRPLGHIVSLFFVSDI